LVDVLEFSGLDPYGGRAQSDGEDGIATMLPPPAATMLPAPAATMLPPALPTMLPPFRLMSWSAPCSFCNWVGFSPSVPACAIGSTRPWDHFWLTAASLQRQAMTGVPRSRRPPSMSAHQPSSFLNWRRALRVEAFAADFHGAVAREGEVLVRAAVAVPQGSALGVHVDVEAVAGHVLAEQDYGVARACVAERGECRKGGGAEGVKFHGFLLGLTQTFCLAGAILISAHKKSGARPLFLRRTTLCKNYAACFSASALSVASQVNSGSSRPKWP
jgi:hypothetical protein